MFPLVCLVVSKSCNRNEFGQTYDNSRTWPDQIYGKWGSNKSRDQCPVPKFIGIKMLFTMQNFRIKIASFAHYGVFWKIHKGFFFFKKKGLLQLLTQIPTMSSILDAWLVFEVFMITRKYRLNWNIFDHIFFLFLLRYMWRSHRFRWKKLNPPKFFDSSTNSARY